MSCSGMGSYFSKLREYDEPFKNLGQKMAGLVQHATSDIEVTSEYVQAITLSKICNYNKTLRVVRENRETLLKLYEHLGLLDVALSTLSFRKSLPLYSIPIFSKSTRLRTEKLYHPLLSKPVTNTVTITNNCIITGSNASGKSTFIKALAVNGILAQTIHTCTAEVYETKPALIMTSMAVSDDILEGDSYFIAEIKSLKRVLEQVKSTYCICYIDEILKGTNTVERIAASTAVLRYLRTQDCRCFVASHDIELAEILEGQYDNYHFCEQIKDDGIFFDYTIKTGPSTTRNAIKLLHYMEFDDQLVADAEALAQHFLNERSWRS